ncbi:hypothetical protein LZ24_03337 [Desulfobotulus alkaliphilus]|uniref:Uncharacterized protein n=1 Tax=Desulfobotulus alkaliphilus TaxID=622671 RepID=A0A562R1A2_9BACT|nr:hypothetical protein [Desulfobotulus alkaliphilus]TWI62849.1 hypothetical protein LZ24_03337 [Desulfobotulus alkaliphilus]
MAERVSHDQNFKNLARDFTREIAEFLSPEILEGMGKLIGFEVVHQETQKQKLKDRHFVLDIPIRFRFENGTLILWLLEFQEDKYKFSIYTVAHYGIDYMKAHPGAIVIPTVLFTDRKKWRKDVDRVLDSSFREKNYIHFEYQKIRLFEYQARDYFDSTNPVVMILLPKMNYEPEEKVEVVMRAMTGLFRLVGAALFEKYLDFIYTYADIQEDEQEELLSLLTEKEDGMLLSERIQERGRYEEKYQTIMSLREFNMKPEDIAKATRLTPEQVKAVLAAGDKGLDLLIGKNATKH